MHTLFEYPLGKPLEAKLLKELGVTTLHVMRNVSIAPTPFLGELSDLCPWSFIQNNGLVNACKSTWRKDTLRVVLYTNTVYVDAGKRPPLSLCSTQDVHRRAGLPRHSHRTRGQNHPEQPSGGDQRWLRPFPTTNSNPGRRPRQHLSRTADVKAAG